MNVTADHTGRWETSPLAPGHPEASALLRQYFVELVGRYYDRPVTGAEVDQVLLDEPSDDLVVPTGYFLVARRDGVPLGCLGVRVLDPDTAELTRMFVHADARGEGVASRLVAAAERAARDVLGARVIRLDTRKDLVEARALYIKHGYTEIPAYNDSPYADHWFEKRLA
ncbi:GNAT family N-acetyltransferase [Streptomyces sp. H10-C2]|uniref:GNAT family N-acetyltransferase n=1 Tax=unclassified Streptomyces TaxID=2593676 RepID=UPI0024BB862C|nr:MULTISPECIES: GNAT family N-acetyltransferase [unclassified Streptomyces]MDJ0345930.1 GNAT family N-acetyltransferase [Streptomyces sp. PH10-H1]MDJ0374779.1 GNAT family N-acetyltransferase [Streptomyces sp. H10-C2]